MPAVIHCTHPHAEVHAVDIDNGVLPQKSYLAHASCLQYLDTIRNQTALIPTRLCTAKNQTAAPDSSPSWLANMDRGTGK